MPTAPLAPLAQETLDQLRALPESAATVLALFYFGNLSEAQVCDRTGMSTLAVRAARARGLAELGRMLQEAEPAR